MFGRCLSIYKHTPCSSVDPNLDFRIEVESALQKPTFVPFLQLEKKEGREAETGKPHRSHSLASLEDTMETWKH